MRTHALDGFDVDFAFGLRRLRRRRDGLGSTLATALVLTIGFVIFAVAASDPRQSNVATEEALAGAPPVWIDIVHPIRLFDLTAPELAKAPPAYAARRNRSGGRQDILTFGALDGPLYVRLILYRVGAEPAPAMPFFVDLARAASAADLAIGHSLAPAPLPTRFGTLEVADLTLAGKADAATPCLGFRGAALAGGFRISGFACGGKELTLSRPALGCLIDRLDLNAAGDDRELAGFFAASELRRNPVCAGAELGPTATHASWLDQNDAPPPLQGKKLL